MGVLGEGAPVTAQGSSSAANPTVVFDSPGQKTVRLTVCNGAGACDTIDQVVEVLDPMPTVLSAVAGVNLANVVPGEPIVAEVGAFLRLVGLGKGKPQLSYGWELVQGTTVLTTLPGADTWLDTTGLAPGVYLLRLLITNPAGNVRSTATLLTLLPTERLGFFTIAPCRVYDSRAVGALGHGATGRSIQVTGGACGLPASARSVVGNLTVVSPTGPGWLAARPGNYPLLVPTNVAFAAGNTRAAFATLLLASDGTGTTTVSAEIAGGGSVHFILDVSGYFAPSL